MDNTTLILIVEDNSITRKMIRVTLEIENYTVLEAENGKECMEITKSQTPNLILLDMNLPDTTGFALAQQFKKKQGLNRPLLLHFLGLSFQKINILNPCQFLMALSLNQLSPHN